MITIEILYDGTRVRSKPEFGDNVVSSLSRGHQANAQDEMVAGAWYQLGLWAYVHESCARPVIVPQPATKLDYVLYKSQWDADAPLRSDCGPVSTWMVLNAMGIACHVTDLRHYGTEGLTTADQLVEDFADFGVKAEMRWFKAEDFVPARTIQLVWYGGLDRNNVWDKNFRGLHWWVYLGAAAYGSQRFRLVHDPDYGNEYALWGRYHHYSEDEYSRAWIPCGGNAERQGVVVIG